MRYIELKEKLKDFTVFSLSDIRRIDRDFYRRRLTEWQDKGYIRKIIRPYYLFSDLKLSENTLFETANRIYDPSYISFESALAYYGLIPESVYGVISATTRRTHVFKTKIGEFEYRTVAPVLFFGYNIVRYGEKCFKIAVPEKAILDYLYLNASIKNDNDFTELRINKGVFSEIINKNRVNIFLRKFRQKTLKKRMSALMEFIGHA